MLWCKVEPWEVSILPLAVCFCSSMEHLFSQHEIFLNRSEDVFKTICILKKGKESNGDPAQKQNFLPPVIHGFSGVRTLPKLLRFPWRRSAHQPTEVSFAAFFSKLKKCSYTLSLPWTFSDMFDILLMWLSGQVKIECLFLFSSQGSVSKGSGILLEAICLCFCHCGPRQFLLFCLLFAMRMVCFAEFANISLVQEGSAISWQTSHCHCLHSLWVLEIKLKSHECCM